MEDGVDYSRKTTDSARKRTRRRAHTRKSPLSSGSINMAEARREIVNALHLHRSSSTPTSSSSSAVNNPAVLKSQNCYRQLADAMPIPEPTWSTTAPAVLCSPVEVNLEGEWFDYYYNLSASDHSWWIGFLNSLDGKNGANESRDGAKGIAPCLDDSINAEKSASSSSDGNGNGNDQSMCMEDWLIFPAAEESCGEQL